MPTTWLVLVYMAGDNSLGQSPGDGQPSPLDADFAQMVAALVQQPDVQVIVEKVDYDNEMTRWSVGNGVQTELNNTDQGPPGQAPAPNAPPVIVDTGVVGPLKDFLSWATENYPAQDVALVVWSHGSGVVDWGKQLASARSPNPIIKSGSVCAIGISKSGHYLTTQEFASELGGCDYCVEGNRFAVVVFDACLMAMVEVAAQLQSVANYMVACEIDMMNPGLPYQQILGAPLNAATSQSGLVSVVLDQYAAVVGNGGATATLAGLDLTKMPGLTAAFGTLVSVMVNNQAAVIAARAVATPVYEFVDLESFLNALPAATFGAAVTPVLNAFANMLMPDGVVVPKGAYCGASLFFPPASPSTANLAIYQALTFPKDTGWAGLLPKLLATGAARRLSKPVGARKPPRPAETPSG